MPDTTPEVLIDQLSPGDVIVHRPYDLAIRCRILREPEHATETVWPLAGRPLVRFWCEREDTGEQGFMSYGPGASVVTG